MSRRTIAAVAAGIVVCFVLVASLGSQWLGRAEAADTAADPADHSPQTAGDEQPQSAAAVDPQRSSGGSFPAVAKTNDQAVRQAGYNDDGSSGRGSAFGTQQGNSLADRLQAIRRTIVRDFTTVSPSEGSPINAPQPAPRVARPPNTGFVESAEPSAEYSSRRRARDGSGQAESSGMHSVLRRNRAPEVAPAELPTEPSVFSEASAYRSTRRTARLPQDDVTPGSDVYEPAPSEDVVLLHSENPSLQVDTSGPRTASVGKPATYTVMLSNAGDATARDVVVSVGISSHAKILRHNASVGRARQQSADGASGLMWQVDQLAGRDQAQLTIEVRPQSNKPIDFQVQWMVKPSPVHASIQVLEPQLEMQLAGPDEVHYGQKSIYRVILSNPGTGPAENVSVRLSSLGGDEAGAPANSIGDIGPGDRKEIEVELTAREAGAIDIHVAASADGGLHAKATRHIRVRKADLQIAASGPKLKYAGSMTVYQIRVANRGDASASEVVAAVALPPGAKYVGGIAGGQPSPGAVTWRLGELAPGSEQTFTLQCQLGRQGDNQLEIGVRGAGDLSATTSIITHVEALADLKLEVNDPPSPQPTGGDVTYQIQIVNRGTKAAEDIHVVAQFSDGIEPAEAGGHGAKLVPGQVIFDPIDRIDAGQSITLSVTAKAQKSGNHIFRAVVTSDHPETRLVSESTTRYFGESSGAK